MITAVTHITLYVRDVDQALAFFTEKVGFLKNADAAFEGDKRWVTVTPPGQDGFEIVLFDPTRWFDGKGREVALAQLGQQPMPILASDDIEGDHARLTAAGVQVDTPVRDLPWGRDFVFADLYGNRYNVVQSKPRQQG